MRARSMAIAKDIADTFGLGVGPESVGHKLHDSGRGRPKELMSMARITAPRLITCLRRDRAPDHAKRAASERYSPGKLALSRAGSDSQAGTMTSSRLRLTTSTMTSAIRSAAISRG